MKRLNLVLLLISLLLTASAVSAQSYPTHTDYTYSNVVTGYQGTLSGSTERLTRGYARFSGTRTTDALTTDGWQAFGVRVTSGTQVVGVYAVRSRGNLFGESYVTPRWRLCAWANPGPGGSCVLSGTPSNIWVDDSGGQYNTADDIAATGAVIMQIQKESSGNWSIHWADNGEASTKLGHFPAALFAGLGSSPTGLNGASSATSTVRYEMIAGGSGADVGNSAGNFKAYGLLYQRGLGGAWMQLGAQTDVADSVFDWGGFDPGELFQGSATCGSSYSSKPCFFAGGAR